MALETHKQCPEQSIDPNATAQRQIRTLRRRVRRQELDRALAELDLSPRQAIVLSILSHRLVRQLTAPPLRTLERGENPTLEHTARMLFEPEDGTS